MKKTITIILFIFSLNIYAQNRFKDAIIKFDSLNSIMLNSFFKNNCNAPSVWKDLSVKLDISTYKNLLTQIGDTLFFYDNEYSISQKLEKEEMFFKYYEEPKNLAAYKAKESKALPSVDYESFKVKFWIDFSTFQTNFNNWASNPDANKNDIINYYSLLNKYLSDSVFIKNNSTLSPYSILYSIVVHTTKQLIPKDKCTNKIKELFAIFKENASSSNANSLNNLIFKLTDKSSALINKYPVPWENHEITVKQRAEVWIGNPSNVIWVFRSFCLFSGTIYKGFNYDRMHYFCTEYKALPCKSESATYDRAGIEWDYRCNRGWEEEVGGREAKLVLKSLNDEVLLFNVTNYRAGLLKTFIDNLNNTYLGNTNSKARKNKN